VAATSLPWVPPGYPSYSGYTTLSITDANKSSLASLTPGVDYKINLTAAISGTTLGTPALQIIGGRNIVIIGGRVHHSATQQQTTCSAMTNVQTTITLASNTGFTAGDRIVVDPGHATASEAMTLGTNTSGTTWNVTRNTGYAGAEGVAVAHTGTPVVKRVANGTNWGIRISDWTGVLHLEGLLINGTSLTQGIYQQNPNTNGVGAQDAVIQLQNCHIDCHADDVRNGNDAHADGWQIANGVAEMRLAYCTIRSTSNGLQWQPYEWDRNWGAGPYVAGDAVRNRLWDLRNVNIAGSTFHTGATGYADTLRSAIYTSMWGTGSTTRLSSNGYGPNRAPELNFENVYAAEATAGDPNLVRWNSADNHEILYEKITIGTPPSGDFCLSTTAGTSYASPGYDKAVRPALLGRERGRMVANTIRGLTKRTLADTGQQVSSLRAFVQMANYRRAVLEADPLWYARMRETTGTAVAEEPMWGQGNGLSANATLNTVTSPIADGGPAYSFNGTTAYARTPTVFGASFFIDQLTLMAFVYVNSPTTGTDQMIMEHTANGTSTVGGFSWFVKSSGVGTHEVIYPDNGFGWNDFPISTTVGWHHFTVQIDRTLAPSATPGAGGIRMYLDGVAQTPNNTGGIAPGGVFDDDFLYFMSRAGSSLFTGGRMAEPAIFPRILDSDEIANIYAQSQELTSGTAALRMVAYDDPIATASSLIGTSDEVVVAAGQRGRWVTFPFTTTPAIGSGDFWTGVFGGTGAGRAIVARTAGGATDGGIKTGLTYPTAPTSITPDSYDQFAYGETLEYAAQTFVLTGGWTIGVPYPSSTGWAVGVT
jgi:hypothetical protein